MSHQEAKAEAQRIIRELLEKHHPGFVVMVIRALHKIQRASKDITIIAEPQKTQATPPQKAPRLENAGDENQQTHTVKSVANRVAK